MKKKVWIPIVASVAAVGLGVGAYLIWGRQGNPVPVQPVENISMGWWGGEDFYSSGMVTTDVSQQIYYEKTMIIDNILVKQGDAVKVGDPIIQVDATLSDIQLQLKKLTVEKKALDIKKAEAELRKLRGQRGRTAAAAPSSPDAAYRASAGNDIDGTQIPYAGDATEENPLKIICPRDSAVLYGFIVEYSQSARSAGKPFYVDLECREGDVPTGELYYSIHLLFRADGSFDFKMEVTVTPTPTPTPVPTPTPTEEPDPTEPPIDPIDPGPAPGPSKDEIDQMIAELEKQIRDDNLEMKKAQMEIRALEKQGTSGIIKSNINGVVKLVANPEELENNQVLIDITGGDGFILQCLVGELSLEKVELGSQMMVEAYGEQGMVSATGIVTEIGDTPVTTQYYDNGNQNASAYIMKVYVDGSANLRSGDYANVTLMSGAQGEDGGKLFVDQAYVRQSGAESYVYIVRDGKLHKQLVSTGKIRYGAIEILSGLTREDQIAFPYGKDVREGAPIESSSDDDTISKY